MSGPACRAGLICAAPWDVRESADPKPIIRRTRSSRTLAAHATRGGRRTARRGAPVPSPTPRAANCRRSPHPRCAQREMWHLAYHRARLHSGRRTRARASSRCSPSRPMREALTEPKPVRDLPWERSGKSRPSERRCLLSALSRHGGPGGSEPTSQRKQVLRRRGFPCLIWG
jgi:hypothetical protein